MNKAITGQLLITIAIFLFGYIHDIALIMNIGIGCLAGMGCALTYTGIRDNE
jgi:hypothetical protein